MHKTKAERNGPYVEPGNDRKVSLRLKPRNDSHCKKKLF